MRSSGLAAREMRAAAAEVCIGLTLRRARAALSSDALSESSGLEVYGDTAQRTADPGGAGVSLGTQQRNGRCVIRSSGLATASAQTKQNEKRGVASVRHAHAADSGTRMSVVGARDARSAAYRPAEHSGRGHSSMGNTKSYDTMRVTQ